jgi:hypothetical protein
MEGDLHMDIVEEGKEKDENMEDLQKEENHKAGLNLDSSEDDQFPDSDVFAQLHTEVSAKMKAKFEKERNSILG